MNEEEYDAFLREFAGQLSEMEYLEDYEDAYPPASATSATESQGVAVVAPAETGKYRKIRLETKQQKPLAGTAATATPQHPSQRRRCAVCDASPLRTDASLCNRCEQPINDLHARCNVCSILLVEEQYMCLRCHDYDLCRWCYAADARSDMHETDHPIQAYMSRRRSHMAIGMDGDAGNNSQTPEPIRQKAAMAGPMTRRMARLMASPMSDMMASLMAHHPTADPTSRATVDPKSHPMADAFTCPVCGVIGLSLSGFTDHIMTWHFAGDYEEVAERSVRCMCPLCPLVNGERQPSRPFLAHFYIQHMSAASTPVPVGQLSNNRMKGPSKSWLEACVTAGAKVKIDTPTHDSWDNNASGKPPEVMQRSAGETGDRQSTPSKNYDTPKTTEISDSSQHPPSRIDTIVKEDQKRLDFDSTKASPVLADGFAREICQASLATSGVETT